MIKGDTLLKVMFWNKHESHLEILSTVKKNV